MLINHNIYCWFLTLREKSNIFPALCVHNKVFCFFEKQCCTKSCSLFHSQGQEPHLPTALATASPQEAKQMLGERLFPLIQQTHPELAGKITGMLLEIDNAELLIMLESREALNAKVEEAVNVLKAHQAKDALAQEGPK